MMNIEFYFDPSCPWCWVTSRWLVEVSEYRDVKIEWLPFSLALKNGELDGDDVTGHLDTHSIAHRVLRIIEAINENKGVDRGVLYTAFGRAYYNDKSLDDDNFIEAVIQKLGLNSEYIDFGDSTKYDLALKTHLENATTIVGDDIGVPLIVFVNENGDKQGFFGPVLQGLPDTQDGLVLFDGLSKFATQSHFFELKRTRKGGSKVKTTMRVAQT